MPLDFFVLAEMVVLPMVPALETELVTAGTGHVFAASGLFEDG